MVTISRLVGEEVDKQAILVDRELEGMDVGGGDLSLAIRRRIAQEADYPSQLHPQGEGEIVPFSFFVPKEIEEQTRAIVIRVIPEVLRDLKLRETKAS